MRFKTGDKVGFIYRNKKNVGEIIGVFPETQILSIKQSDSPIDLLFSDKAVAKVEEPELVVVPKFVDDWFIFCTSVGYDLANALYIVKGHMPVAIYEWLQNNNDNQELLARAWMDGYEVEKEPLYYVKLPISKRNEATDELEVINMCLLLNIRSRETCISGNYRWVDKLKRTGWRTKLTEAQIKGMPEGDIYWQFAVLVDEADGEDNE
ncbi:DUF1642 domain-containing protein [Listeria innocua]|nr:DUF1642 domain-containing protein [Listeria innocua]EAE2481358.1 DUF1642 domain-containing protein [Listeria innocua]EKM1328903.1 DUF1642 domain-containing protein [Listeria innocua]EKM1463768.1 DUF1642 domain-containing protein [Listeria innocua]HCJ4342731.1 DUF1642 domain-containing protein [Listeria innocua]